MQKDFDKVYMFYDTFMKLFNLYKEREILNLLNLKGDERIIDIGGGTGYVAKSILPYCKQIYVIDESQKMLSKINNEKIITICGNALKTRLESDYFDIVILTDVLHHIKEKDELFLEILRILKKGGKILIYDFDINHIRTKLLKLFEYFLFGKNLYFIDRLSLEKFLKEYNFKEINKIVKDFYFIILWEKI